MNLIKQPRRGYCLITSFAMCLDVTVNDLIAEIGHDGMEITFPEAEEPDCYRGFHLQELIDCAFGKGFAVTQIEAIWQIINNQNEIVTIAEKPDRFYEYMENSKCGILLGEAVNGIAHATAWDGSMIYDPVGRVYPLVDAGQNNFKMLQAFLKIDRIL